VRSLWLIPLAPAAAAAATALLGRWLSRAAARTISASAAVLSIALSVWASLSLLAADPSARVRGDELGSWIPAVPVDTASGIGMFSVNWSVRLDPLAAILLVTICALLVLIQLFAGASMREGFRPRLFCWLNLFGACLLLLVLGANYLVMFAGWAGATLTSIPLVDSWHETPRTSEAATLPLLVNGAADAALLLGIVLVFFTFGTLDFREVATDAASRETAGLGRLSAICLLLLVSAGGKSAQLALDRRRSPAGGAPAAARALVHVSIAVAAVYVLARNAALFLPIALWLLAR
jgi:NADH-quinone oxidoreductase subunit L